MDQRILDVILTNNTLPRNGGIALSRDGLQFCESAGIKSMWKTLSMMLLFALLTINVFADATIPEADIEGAKDHPAVGRFAGSFIVSYTQKDYDEVAFPLSALEAVEGKTDAYNNTVFEPNQKKTVEGKRTRLVYLTPAGSVVPGSAAQLSARTHQSGRTNAV
jgi:hypothetical protein